MRILFDEITVKAPNNSFVCSLMALAIISALSFEDKPNNRINTTPAAIRRKRKTN